MSEAQRPNPPESSTPSANAELAEDLAKQAQRQIDEIDEVLKSQPARPGSPEQPTPEQEEPATKPEAPTRPQPESESKPEPNQEEPEPEAPTRPQEGESAKPPETPDGKYGSFKDNFEEHAGGRKVMSLAERDIQLKIAELKKAGKFGEAQDLEKISADQQTHYQEDFSGRLVENPNPHTQAAEALRARGMAGAADELQSARVQAERDKAAGDEQKYQDIKSEVTRMVSQSLAHFEGGAPRVIDHHADGKLSQAELAKMYDDVYVALQAESKPFFQLKSKSSAGGRVLETYYKCAADKSGNTLLVERRSRKTGEIISISTVTTEAAATNRRGILRRAERPSREALRAVEEGVRFQDSEHASKERTKLDGLRGSGYSNVAEYATGMSAKGKNKPRRRSLMDFFIDSFRGK